MLWLLTSLLLYLFKLLRIFLKHIYFLHIHLSLHWLFADLWGFFFVVVSFCFLLTYYTEILFIYKIHILFIYMYNIYTTVCNIFFIYIYRIYIHIYIEYTIRLLHINSLLYINLFIYFTFLFFSFFFSPRLLVCLLYSSAGSLLWSCSV